MSEGRSGAVRRTRMIATVVALALLVTAALATLAAAQAGRGKAPGGPSPRAAGPHGAGKPGDDLDGSPRGDEKSDVIPNRYIVVFKDSVANPRGLAAGQVKQRGGKLGFLYSHAIKGYSAKLSKGAAQALRNDPRVKRVEPVRRVEGFSQTTPTGVQRVHADENPALDIDEKDDKQVNADIAIIDSGVDQSHPDLDVDVRVDCTDRYQVFNEELWEWEWVCKEGAGSDEYGHGTHVAGIAAAIDNSFGVVGVAPGADLWSVKVLDENNEGYSDDILAAIDWVTEHASQIEVANMSLGGGGKDSTQEEAIDASVDEGVVYVVAAGNDSTRALGQHPANGPDVITVSGLADTDGEPGGEGGSCSGADDTAYRYTNWGEEIEIAAPGTCIYSTLPSGGSTLGEDYGTVTGTSMASPHVAGAAAVLASQDNPQDHDDVEDIRDDLIEAGSLDWSDTSEDGAPEPLLYVGGDELEGYEAQTGGWTSTNGTSATVTGAFENRSWGELTYWFNYGLTTEYGPYVGNWTSYDDYKAVSAGINNLIADKNYHYRIGSTAAGPWEYDWGEDRILTPSRWSFKSPATEPAQTGNEWLNDVDCLSQGFCMAVGRNYNSPERRAISYRRTTEGDWYWKLIPVAEKDGYGNEWGEAEGVSCSSSTACTAVGTHDDSTETAVPLADRWNGSSWSSQSISAPSGAQYSVLEDVSCPTSSECVAVGYYKNSSGTWVNYSAKWSGGSWSNLSTPNPEGFAESELDDIDCPSAELCIAVGWWAESSGGSKPVTMKWNGSSWSLQSPAYSTGTLRGISCASSTSCMAVGSRAQAWDGEEWSKVGGFASPPGGGGIGMNEVSCLSPTSCTAAGTVSNRPRVHASTQVWTGEGWVARVTPRKTTRRHRFWGVSCVEGTGCTAVGDSYVDKDYALFETRPNLPPTATTEGATTFVKEEDGRAKLHGKVNPNSFPTDYRFEWGTEEELEEEELKSAPVPDGELEGVEPLPVEGTIKGLEPSTTYYYRLVAESPEAENEGKAIGELKSFTTPDWKPLFTAGPRAIEIGREEATITVAIDTRGFKTNYRVEYGKTEAYGNSFPIPDAELEAGYGYTDIYPTPKGLEPNQTYNYRVTAENVNGDRSTEDATFTTDTSGFILDESDPHPLNYKGDIKPESGQFVLGFEGGDYYDCLYTLFVTEGAERAEELTSDGWGEVGSQPCEAPGLYPKLDRNGCELTFNPGAETEEGKFGGEMQIGPPGCGPMELERSVSCTYSIFPQSGLEASFENVTQEPYGERILVDVDSSELRYTGEGTVCSGGLHRNGVIDAHWDLQAWNDTDEPINTQVTGAFYEIPPVAYTHPATAVTREKATLHGRVNPNQLETSYQLQYTEQADFEENGWENVEAVPVSPEGIGSGIEPVAVEETAKGLEPGTAYAYRIVATNSEGSGEGDAETFTTVGLHFPRLEAEAYPATISGSQDVEGELELGFLGLSVTCDTGAFDGELGEATDELFLGAEYDGCHPSGEEAERTVAMNSCELGLGVEKTGPPYVGAAAISCAEEGDAVELSWANCTIEFPPQPLNATVSYENQGEGSERSVSAAIEAEEIFYETTAGICQILGKEHEDGELSNAFTLEGEDSEEEALGVYLTGEEFDFLGLYLTGEESEEEAEQPRVEAEEYPATILGEQAPGGELELVTAANSTSCETPIFTFTLGEAAEELSPGIEYGDCHTSGEEQEHTLALNSCTLDIGVANAGPPYVGDLAIACAEGGDAIEVEQPNCMIELPPQELNGAVSYENQGEGSERSLGVAIEAEEVSYEFTAGICQILGKEHEDGELNNAFTLYGIVSPFNSFFVEGEESEEESKQPKFAQEGYPGEVSGSLDSASDLTLVFGVTAAEAVCDDALFGGEPAEASSTLALSASLSDCINPGSESSVPLTMNSCQFTWSLDNDDSPFMGGVGVECSEEGDAVVAEFPNCTVGMPAQQPVGSVEYENRGSGVGRSVHVSAEAEGLDYLYEGGICQILGEEHEDGELDASFTVEGP